MQRDTGRKLCKIWCDYFSPVVLEAAATAPRITQRCYRDRRCVRLFTEFCLYPKRVLPGRLWLGLYLPLTNCGHVGLHVTAEKLDDEARAQTYFRNNSFVVDSVMIPSTEATPHVCAEDLFLAMLGKTKCRPPHRSSGTSL